jgi:hypothetical protein
MSTIYNGSPGNESRAASVNIASSTNATPTVITTSAAHGLIEGDRVDIVGHQTNTAANGAWYAHVLTPTTFALYSGWSAGSVATPVAGNGVGGATGNVTYLGLTPRVTLPDDASPITTAAPVNVGLEDAKDAQAWLAERVGAYRLAGRISVTKAVATPGAAVTVITTCSTNAWGGDANADGAWAVRPQIGVDVNDYVEVDMTGTVSVGAVPANNLALGIGFVFKDYGAAFALGAATMQDGYSQFESGHILAFNLKSRLLLTTLLAGIVRGSVLYPVLMNYGIAGATTYQLLGDLSCTIRLWRPN